MLTTTLIKHGHDRHVAHIYEHIFCIRLASYLESKGLYQFIDYSLDARTYHDGNIFLFFVFNDNKSEVIKKLLDKIKHLHIDFDHEITDIAIKQVEAEYGYIFDKFSADELAMALARLHDSSWMDSRKLGLILPSHKKSKPLLKKGKKTPQNVLNIALSAQKLSSDLMPLFRLFGGVYLNNLLNNIADTYGGFVNSAMFSMEQGNLIGEVLFTNSVPISQSIVKQMYDEVLQDINKKHGDERLMRIFQNLELCDREVTVTNTYEDTGLIVGVEGWKDLATRKNINIVIDASYLKVNIA